MPNAHASTSDDHSRERWIALARFTWHRFLDDKCFEAAGALSYTTIFALVPLTTAVFGIIAAFPVFNQWSAALTDFVFSNFVPATGRVVRDYLTQFAANASQLTSAGVIVLLFSALLMMSSVEDTYNRIWRVPARRRRATRFIVYWTVLTLGPILIAASLGLSSYVFALPGVGDLHLADRLLAFAPVVVTWTAITLSFLVIPNGGVRFRHAALGGLLATLLFEGAKQAFATFLGRASYEQIYGTLAVVPIFLIWIYVSWSVVLLGASLAASLSAFRFQPAILRVPPGLEFVALLRMFRTIHAGTRDGRPPTRSQLAIAQPGLTDDQLDRFLALLREHKLVHRSEAGEFLLLRDPSAVSLRDLFEAGAFHWPSAVDLDRFAGQAGADDEPLQHWLKSAHAGLHAALSAPLTQMLTPAAPSGPTTTERPLA